ncbi:MAG: B12-binding domain-containing radical SAM protein [Candidatus Rifleibacteriota bacterium]
MEELLLLAPPLHFERHLRRSFQPPLNLLYLCSFLRHRGVSSSLHEALSVDDAVKVIVDRSPLLVGIPLYYASLPTSFAIVKKVKEICPGIRFVAGGPCLTMEPDRMMSSGGFDFGIRGEGEETLFELYRALKQDSVFAAIEGLVYVEEGCLQINELRSPIKNLDDLPFLDFSLIENDYYFDFQQRSGVPRTIFLNTSRGCSFRCSYCCTPVLWPGPVRRYSPERMMNEIIFQLQRFPGVEIGFCDDSFFSDHRWLDRFLQLVKPIGLKFQCIGRADHLDSEYIEKLAAAGMTYIAFGVETGNQNRQARLRKHLDFKRMFETMACLQRFDVKTKCFFMLGFPDETPEEMVETINLAAELKKAGMDYFSIFPVTVYPGTELAQQFSCDSFQCGLDAHMPEIIRDGLEITSGNEFLDSRYNDFLTQRQMAEVVSFAWQTVELGQSITLSELLSIMNKSGGHTTF